MNTLIVTILSFAAFLLSLTVHECCHAATAYLLGDETARRAGRLSLNPRSHIDPVGTLLLPLLGLFTGLPMFGWAKPVPVNPYNLRWGRWGNVAVALAGPLSNFILAGIALIIVRILLGPVGLSAANLLIILLIQLAVVSVVLGVFNFIPVPPLDGSRLLTAFLDSPRHRRLLFILETRGATILLLILMLDYMLPFSPFSWLINRSLYGFFSAAGLLGAL